MEGVGDYRILTAPDGQGVGGLMTLPDGAPMKPGWFCYIGVQDVDRSAEKIKSLGGSVHLGPQDIPGVGRFAMVADPQGMAFYIMRGDSQQDSRAFHVTAPGHCGWNELVTRDHKAALAFTANCSAGRITRRCRWGRWANTASSIMPGSGLAR